MIFIFLDMFELNEVNDLLFDIGRKVWLGLFFWRFRVLLFMKWVKMLYIFFVIFCKFSLMLNFLLVKSKIWLIVIGKILLLFVFFIISLILGIENKKCLLVVIEIKWNK